MNKNEKKDLTRIMLDIQALRWYYKTDNENNKYFVDDDYFYNEAMNMIKELLK